MQEKLDLVRATVENRESSVDESVTRLVRDLAGLGQVVEEQRTAWSNRSLLDYMAGRLESVLRECRDLQGKDLAAGELRAAYKFLIKE